MNSMIFLGYLLVVNLIAFAMYGIDKWTAARNKWRIPEARLLLIAVFGGSLGAWGGMFLFRHKTQHLKFKYGIPAILILQLAAIGCVFVHWS